MIFFESTNIGRCQYHIPFTNCYLDLAYLFSDVYLEPPCIAMENSQFWVDSGITKGFCWTIHKRHWPKKCHNLIIYQIKSNINLTQYKHLWKIATRYELEQVRLILFFWEIVRSPYCGKYYSHSAELANGTQYHKSRKQHQKAMKYHDKQVTETFVPTFAEKKKISELPDMIFLWL